MVEPKPNQAQERFALPYNAPHRVTRRSRAIIVSPVDDQASLRCAMDRPTVDKIAQPDLAGPRIRSPGCRARTEPYKTALHNGVDCTAMRHPSRRYHAVPGRT